MTLNFNGDLSAEIPVGDTGRFPLWLRNGNVVERVLRVVDVSYDQAEDRTTVELEQVEA